MIQTIGTVKTFLLAMLLHPKAQLAAQDELDRVIGRNRLPEMGDQDSLPYVSAVVKEVMR